MSCTLRNTFNDIYNSYYKKSFLFAKSYVHDDLAAEDIASESLIKLWEKLKVEDINYPAPLLFTILKNKALDYLKHEAVKHSAIEILTDWHQQEFSIRISSLDVCSPNDIFSDEVEHIIYKTLNALSEQNQQIFRLSRFEYKSNKEIAKQVGLSEKGVEYHISRSLKALRVALKDYLPLFYFFFYY